MKLTRKALAALGIESDKIDSIIEMHTEVTDGMKETISILEDENKKYKADADKLSGVQKELDELKEQVATDVKNREGKDYDKLKEEFDNYKAEQENKAIKASKDAAFREIMKDMKISEKHADKLLKYYKEDIANAELGEDGKFKTTKDLMKALKDEWAELVETESVAGAKTETPPTNTGKSGKTKEEIMKIKDTAERQKAIAENPEVFGIE